MRIGERLTTPDIVIATDLDGTFLGGSEEDRRSLYGWIEAQRARIGLVFVTGRDLPFIEELCATTPVPWPDYVIGDVGTTIARVDAERAKATPDPALEAPIAARWGDRGDWVRSVLADAPGLTPQDGPFRYRMSYHYDPARFDPDVTAPIEAAGLDCLISAGCFFDVLPGGVSKGPTLLRLIESIEIDPDRVLVAGDTMNDLSLFETGLKGVAVGNSEPELIARIARRDPVCHARAEGAGGILEAIGAHGLWPQHAPQNTARGATRGALLPRPARV